MFGVKSYVDDLEARIEFLEQQLKAATEWRTDEPPKEGNQILGEFSHGIFAARYEVGGFHHEFDGWYDDNGNQIYGKLKRWREISLMPEEE